MAGGGGGGIRVPRVAGAGERSTPAGGGGTRPGVGHLSSDALDAARENDSCELAPALRQPTSSAGTSGAPQPTRPLAGAVSSGMSTSGSRPSMRILCATAAAGAHRRSSVRYFASTSSASGWLAGASPGSGTWECFVPSRGASEPGLCAFAVAGTSREAGRLLRDTVLVSGRTSKTTHVSSLTQRHAPWCFQDQRRGGSGKRCVDREHRPLTPAQDVAISGCAASPT